MNAACAGASGPREADGECNGALHDALRGEQAQRVVLHGEALGRVGSDEQRVREPHG